MAGPEERYGRGNETAAEIAKDDASADAAAPRWNKTAGKGGGAMSDGDRATAAMASRHDRFAGSAVGVGSVRFDDYGVYTSADGAVGEGEVAELPDRRSGRSLCPHGGRARPHRTSCRRGQLTHSGRVP